MYTIKAASELTDLPAATLRAWERRYGIARPQRTDSGYRLYDEQALGEIRAMQALLNEGWAPRQAADEVIRRRPTALLPESATADTFEQHHIDAFVSAAASLDEQTLRRIMDQAFSRGSYEHVLDQWLTPSLQALGAAWHAGALDISAEHFATAAVMRRLGSMYESAATPAAGPLVLVGLPPGAIHEIGSLAFAVAARRLGIDALYLGPDLPEASWVSSVQSSNVAAVVMSLSLTSDVAAASKVAERLRAVKPELCIAVGGAQARHFNGATLTFDGTIPEAARALATHLNKIPGSGRSNA